MARIFRKRSQRKPRPPIDVEPFRAAVNLAAARVRGLWLGYIALLAYLFVAVGAVTQRDLLLENSVKLPVLNVELPLVGFFAVAPLFFLINHFYLLLQLMVLGGRIREFNDALHAAGLDEKTRTRERRKLDTFMIVLLLGGTQEEREDLTGKFLETIALITLVIAPIALLLTTQLQFLPYQYERVTWWHRIALGIDMTLLWTFWPSIRQGEWASWRGTPNRIASVSILLIFSCGIATFPGEMADGGINAKYWKRSSDSYLWQVKEWLFGDLEPFEPRSRLLPFSRSLDIPDNRTLIDPAKLEWLETKNNVTHEKLAPLQSRPTVSLRRRSLRGARFDRSDLRNADFSNASLQGASLFQANLQGAIFESTELQSVHAWRANLQGAWLAEANIQGAILGRTELQGAFLFGGKLQGVSLDEADLRGATLISARLEGASLNGTKLQGALLGGAHLQHANLRGAQLQGASLSYANLQAAILDSADLRGASLVRANLQGASLYDVRFQGASLDRTFLWRTFGTIDQGSVANAWINEPKMEPPSIEELTDLKLAALDGVESEFAKLRIKSGYDLLFGPKEDIPDLLPQGFWSDLAGKVREVDHRKELAIFLTELACKKIGAPYIVRGLIRQVDLYVSLDPLVTIPPRLEATGPFLPQIAKEFLNAAEGISASCPGARDLDQSSLARLREWASQTEANTR